MKSRVTNSLVMHFDGEGHECGFFLRRFSHRVRGVESDLRTAVSYWSVLFSQEKHIVEAWETRETQETTQKFF